MNQIIRAASSSERLQTVDYMRRKARNVRLQATAAAPALSAQLQAFADLIEAEADQLETSASLSSAALEH
ncbi:MAG TPA: hypothetical protein VGP48_03810 [Stellaceae bacterium]|nr:hypothetical protein [Stellaceae bacterium]